MTMRSFAAILLCTVGLAAMTAPVALAGPNGHANEHAGNGGGNGNGNAGGNGGGNGGDHGNGGTATATPHAVVRQYALANGLKQGDVAKTLKSWNSLNANPKAFLNNLDNPNSLKGKQAQYICDNATSQTALTDFTDLNGDPNNPPTAQDATDAQDYLDSLALLGEDDPQTVVDAPDGTYSDAEIAAANTVLNSQFNDADSAQAVLDQRAAWLAYQGSAQQASDLFAAASVSYHGTTDLTDLRKTVDGIIALKGLDTSALCNTSVASAQ